MKTSRIAFACLGVAAVSAVIAAGVGYDDTPLIPGQKWKVHDKNRPNPPIVVPAETFSHSAPAPADAKVLFDGKSLAAWKSGNSDAKWKVEE